MDEILKLCNDLAFALRKAIDKEGKRAEDNTKREASLDGREAVLAKGECSMKAREAIVAKVEDVMGMRDAAALKWKQAEQLIAKTQDEKDANDRANELAKAEVAREKAALAKNTKDLLDEKEAIKKEWKMVRAKEASYKEDVKKEFLGKLK